MIVLWLILLTVYIHSDLRINSCCGTPRIHRQINVYIFSCVVLINLVQKLLIKLELLSLHHLNVTLLKSLAFVQRRKVRPILIIKLFLFVIDMHGSSSDTLRQQLVFVNSCHSISIDYLLRSFYLLNLLLQGFHNRLASSQFLLLLDGF
jgi:hypothetical protein